MARSVIELCNNALQDLGEEPVSSLAEATKAARLCNQRWPSVRDAVLRAHPWNCAMRLTELAPGSEQPLWKWDYQYVLPPDFLRVVALTGPAGEFIHQWEVIGGSVLCNEAAPVQLAYVRRETDPVRYDPLLGEALSARLAAVLAYPLTGSTSLSKTLWESYSDKLREARGVDAREGAPEAPMPMSWLTAKMAGR